jgi:hypothetical protein
MAQAEQAESKEEWIAAAEAVRLLKPVFKSAYEAQKAICTRACGGMIRSRARRFTMNNAAVDGNCEIPMRFWWAEGGTALGQDWTVGDFDTYVDSGQVRLQATRPLSTCQCRHARMKRQTTA